MLETFLTVLAWPAALLAVAALAVMVAAPIYAFWCGWHRRGGL